MDVENMFLTCCVRSGEYFNYFAGKYILICLPAIALCASGEFKPSKGQQAQGQEEWAHTLY